MLTFIYFKIEKKNVIIKISNKETIQEFEVGSKKKRKNSYEIDSIQFQRAVVLIE